MKNLLLALSLLLFSFSYSQDWKLISEADNQAYFYKSNTENTAWIKEISEKIEYYPKNSKVAKIVEGYSLTLFKFDCNNKKIGLLQTHTYSKDGKLLGQIEINEFLVDMTFVIPDTLGERFFNVFCNKEN